MSLINQMLRDLDARRAAHEAGNGLPNDVRPLPAAQSARWPVWLGIAALVILALGSYFWYVREDAHFPTPPVLPVAVAPSAVSTDAGQVPPADAAKMAERKIENPVPVAVTARMTLAGIDGSLRLADTIAPAGQPASEPKPAPAKPPAREARELAGKSARGLPMQTRSEKAAEKKASPDARTPAKDTKANVAGPVSPKPIATAPAAVEKSARPAAIERTVAASSPRERSEAEYRKAISAVGQGHVPEALERLQEALRQDGLHVAARQLQVKLLLESRKTDDAIRVLQEGIAGQPAQIGWAMSLARLQVDGGDLAGAWKTLDFSRPAAAKNADYLGFCAHVLQRLGRNQEAAEQYLQATRVAPADGRWWLGLGLTLDALGRAAEARDAFLRARQSGNLGPELLALIEQKLR